MENSENKSLISTRSSKLTKKEKLLSITQKIVSEIKPQYESERIGDQEWITRNLDVARFRNGDLIPHIESDEEWEEYGKNGQPAWCYYDNDPENGKKYGKLYNWFAVNDPRGLVPEGNHVPTDEEWTILVAYLGGEEIVGHKMKSVEGWDNCYEDVEIQNRNGDNSSGFNGLPGGFRVPNGSFYGIRDSAFFWSATENGLNYAWIHSLYSNDGDVDRYYDHYSKSFGTSVRGLRD
jgi:uncharacterized protein (TIGR02145 family)